jgi:Asp-tRNA(Asn)/Glu-tRNA(Gln) amidotransferase A subunit family amidase
MVAEFGEQHATRFARWGALYSGPSAAQVDESRRVTAAERRLGLEGRQELRDRLHRLLDAEGIDALVCPSATGAAPRGLTTTGDPVMNVPWTHAGVPAINLPTSARIEGMPLGLQVVGRFGGDEALLADAAYLEHYV